MKKTALILILAVSLGLTIVIVIGGGLGERSITIQLNDGGAVAFAHRGLANEYVENSQEAFAESVKLGFNALEVDISLTQDNRLVVFHDESCDRLLGIEEDIDQLDWNEIKDKPLLFNNLPTSNRVLLAKDFIKSFGDSNLLYLDIKVSKTIVADSLISYIKKMGIYESALVADESIRLLSYIKYKDPKIRTVLEGFDAYNNWIYYLIPKNFKPDFYACTLSDIDEDHLQFLIKNKLMDRKIVYGIDYQNVEKIFGYGIKNIIVDHDSLLSVETLRGQLDYYKYVKIENR